MNAQNFNAWFVDDLDRHGSHNEYGMEPPASLEMAIAVESLLGRDLPHEYRHFVMTHGSGPVIFNTIASLDPGSPDYILGPCFTNMKGGNGDPILQVMPDECGGFYGFPLEGDIYQPTIVYVYESEGTHEESSPSFFQHLVDTMIPGHLR